MLYIAIEERTIVLDIENASTRILDRNIVYRKVTGSDIYKKLIF